MRTQAQIEASKTNGAKSSGPITQDGRARSSQNAIRHGLTSHKSVIIEGESKEEWESFERHFFLKFQPRDFVEERMVIEMAVCQWRLERIRKMQVSLMDRAIADELPVIEEFYEGYDMQFVQAAAHTSRKLDLQYLDQHETRLSRRFDRALRTFNEIHAKFPPVDILENEPEAPSTPTEVRREPEVASPTEPPPPPPVREERSAFSENEPKPVTPHPKLAA